MANSKEPYQSTHTGAEIDAAVDLLDKNIATQGQVLTADGHGGASWQDAVDGTEVVQNTGASTTAVMSQKAVTDAIATSIATAITTVLNTAV